MSAQFQEGKIDFGLGLRACHFGDALDLLESGKRPVSWFEIISENYLEQGGRALAVLRKLRRDFPVAMHGVSLNLGSSDPLGALGEDYLQRLRERVREFEPWAVSDHLCWTGVHGRNLHALLPLPYTEEALDLFCRRVERVQDFLGRQILIENLSSYLQFEHDEMAEWEFLRELSRRSGCGLLLDINNVYVSSVNHGFDPMTFIRAIAPASVKQIHLAGHSAHFNDRGRKVLIDTHSADVSEEVWMLYQKSLGHLGFKPVMIERDEEIPAFEDLCRELEVAKRISGQERSHELIAASI